MAVLLIKQINRNNFCYWFVKREGGEVEAAAAEAVEHRHKLPLSESTLN